MKHIIKSGLFILSAIAPAIVVAHPGHGETGGYTIIHYFVEPQHAIVSIGLVALSVFLFNKFKQRFNQKIQDK